MIRIALIGLGVGALIAWFMPLTFPSIYGKYLSVALLASLDTVFGGIRASLERQFDLTKFIIGFSSNSVLAAVLVASGDALGIDLYYVALITFGIRIFNNTGQIRNLLIIAYRRKKLN